MKFKVSTPLMEAFEELNKINEAANYEVSKKFWAAAKAGQIDAEAFHAAYDDELKALGLMDMFDSAGVIENNYGRIKRAKDENPDSWALKALGKLWALKYKDNAKFPSEIALDQKKDRATVLTQEYNAVLTDALKAVDQSALAEYKALANVTDADFRVSVIRHLGKDTLNIQIGPSGFLYLHNPAADKLTELTTILNKILQRELPKYKSRAIRKEFQKIDIFANNSYADAILLGDSGTLYEVGTNGMGNLMISVNGGEYVPAYKIDESYEVIYTRTNWSNNNYSTRRDTESAAYYSWNSKHEDKLGNKIPKSYGIEDGYMGNYDETKKVTNSSSPKYSHADGIDSWAEAYSFRVATD